MADNKLTIFAPPTAEISAADLELLDASDEEYVDPMGAEVDIRDLLPAVKLPKQGERLEIHIGNTAHQTQGRVLYFAIIASIGGRALFPPRGEENNAPICWAEGTNAECRNDDTVGTFTIGQYPTPHELAEGDNPPEGADISFFCRGCRYNQFGSKAEHDPAASGSRAKACGESRTFVLMMMEQRAMPHPRNPDFQIFVPSNRFASRLNPMGLLYARLNYGTHRKTMKKIGLAPDEFKISPKGLVFGGVNKIENSAGNDYGTLDVRVEGQMHPQVLRMYDAIKEEGDRVMRELSRQQAANPAADVEEHGKEQMPF